MPDDLVSRIRDNALDPLDFDAADEIERLRAALRTARDYLARLDDQARHAGAAIDGALSPVNGDK